MIWEILNSFKSGKILKLRLHYQKNMLCGKIWVWLDILLIPQKDKEDNLTTQRFFEEKNMWFIDTPSYLCRSHKWGWDFLGSMCGEAFCLREWISVTYMGEPQDSWEFYTSRAWSVWTKKDRNNLKIKKAPGYPEVYRQETDW